MVKRIIVESVVVEPSNDDKVHILYTPLTTQVLQAGREYELILEDAVIKLKKKVT